MTTLFLIFSFFGGMRPRAVALFRFAGISPPKKKNKNKNKQTNKDEISRNS